MSDSDIDLVEEFNNVKQWAEEIMILNLQKTKEIVFRRPNPRLDMYPQTQLLRLSRFFSAKLLGVTLCETAKRFDLIFMLEMF